MKWAVAVGLIEGMGNGKLEPRGNSLRCQLAAILYRFNESQVDIDLLATSDVHGQVYATDYTASSEGSGTYH